MSVHGRISLGIVLCLLLGSLEGWPGATSPEFRQSPASRLLIVWTSADRDVALNMVTMYTYNATKSGWWDKIRFIVWGPSSRLLAENTEIQKEILRMKDAGVELVACKACADRYGVSESLEKLGLVVKYVGQDLTDMLKQGWVTLTF
ncbi:MAG: DsrE family protein [Candidatus Aminicenantales bacterium]